jgi:hypothetical protein
MHTDRFSVHGRPWTRTIRAALGMGECLTHGETNPVTATHGEDRSRIGRGSSPSLPSEGGPHEHDDGTTVPEEWESVSSRQRKR